MDPMLRRSYCTCCDDYGHDAQTHQEYISMSEFRRLRVVQGEHDWWVDQELSSEDGLVCIFCSKTIDWAPSDHEVVCPVRRFLNMGEEEK